MQGLFDTPRKILHDIYGALRRATQKCLFCILLQCVCILLLVVRIDSNLASGDGDTDLSIYRFQGSKRGEELHPFWSIGQEASLLSFRVSGRPFLLHPSPGHLLRSCDTAYQSNPHRPHFRLSLVTTTPTPLQLFTKPPSSSFYLVTPLLPFFPIIESHNSLCMSPYGS